MSGQYSPSAEQSVAEIDHDYTANPVCPHCGYEHEDTTPNPSIQGWRKQCEECNAWFLVTCEVEITWSTSKL